MVTCCARHSFQQSLKYCSSDCGLECVRAEVMQRRTFIIPLAFIRSIKKFNTCENVPPPNAFAAMEEIRNSFKVGLVCLWAFKDDSLWDDSILRWSQATH